MKHCNKCDTTKSLDEFSADSSKKDNKNSWCKSCMLKNKMKRRRMMKLKAIEYKGGECLHCRTKYPPEAYEFHPHKSKRKGNES